MARNLAFVALMIVIVGLIVWQAGVFSPTAPVDDGGADALAPSALDGGASPSVADDGASKADPALAQGGKKPVPRTKPVADGPHIRGKVTDRAGKPVADVHVFAIPDTYTKTFVAKDVGREGVPVSDTVTEADGKFEVAVSRDAPYHAIVAEAAGFAVAFESQVPTNGDVTLVLDRAGVYRGTVTDADGLPLVGARVRLLGLADAYRVEIEAKAGDGGQYRLEGVPVAFKARSGGRGFGMNAALEISADGYASVSLAAAPAPEAGQEKERHFILSRGAVVVGKVVDAESDAPVEGAKVVLWASDGNMGSSFRPGGAQVLSPFTPRLVAESVSDASGSFRLEHIPCQGFHPVTAQEWTERGQALGRVAAIKDGCSPSSATVPIGKDGERIEVTIKVWGTATVEGRVVDAAGAPVKGASVSLAQNTKDRGGWGLPKSLFPDAMPVGYSGEVGEDGKYRMLLAVARRTEEEIKLVGRLPRRYSGFQPYKPDGDGSITVRAKSGATIAAPDLVVKPSDDGANMILTRVRVLAPDGKPVWGANVSSQSGRVYGGGGGGEQRTDADGNTTVAWFSPPQWPLSGPQTITVTARGFASTPAVANPTPGSEESVTVTMRVAHTIAGRVLKADRSAASGVQIMIGDGSIPIAQVFPEQRQSGGQPMPMARPTPPKPGVLNPYWGGATTDDDGRFTVEGLPEGPYHVVAMSGRSSRINGMAMPFGGGPGRATLSDVPTDTTSLELVLPADNAPPTGVLVGVVRDGRTGRPPKGLSVMLRRGDDAASSAAGGMPQWFDTGGGNFVMAPSGGALSALIPSPGRYEFSAAPAGSWTVVASGEGYTQRTAEVVVRAGETVTVGVLDLERGTTVRGRVQLPDGADAKGRSLIFSDYDAAGGPRSLSVVLRDDATFELSGFTPGRWRVVSYGGPSSADRPQPALMPSDGGGLTVPPGASDVTFEPAMAPSGVFTLNANDPRLPPGQWDGASATDEQRRFSDGVAVTLTDAAGGVVAEQRGGFRRDFAGRLSGLPLLPGRYTVKIALPGESPREHPIDVPAGGNAMAALNPQAAPGLGGVPVPTAPIRVK